MGNCSLTRQGKLSSSGAISHMPGLPSNFQLNLIATSIAASALEKRPRRLATICCGLSNDLAPDICDGAQGQDTKLLPATMMPTTLLINYSTARNRLFPVFQRTEHGAHRANHMRVADSPSVVLSKFRHSRSRPRTSRNDNKRWAQNTRRKYLRYTVQKTMSSPRRRPYAAHAPPYTKTGIFVSRGANSCPELRLISETSILHRII